jgi:hypothetical protein
MQQCALPILLSSVVMLTEQTIYALHATLLQLFTTTLQHTDDRMVPRSSTSSSSSAELNTVPAAVKLRVGDLLDGASSAARQLQLREVDRAILQANSELKSAFKLHSRGAVVAAKDSSNSSATFAMTCTQLLMYLRSIHALSPLTYVQDADVYRALFRMRRQHALELQASALESSISGSTGGLILYREDPSELFDCSRPVLFREFVELLVRLAVLRFAADPTPIAVAVPQTGVPELQQQRSSGSSSSLTTSTPVSATSTAVATAAATAASAGGSSASSRVTVGFTQAVQRFLTEHVLAFATTGSSSSSSSNSTTSFNGSNSSVNKLSRPPVQPQHLQAVAAAEAAVTEAKPSLKRLFLRACAQERAATGYFCSALSVRTLVRYIRDARLLYAPALDARALLRVIVVAVPGVTGGEYPGEALHIVEVLAAELVLEQLQAVLVAVAAHIKAAQADIARERDRSKSEAATAVTTSTTIVDSTVNSSRSNGGNGAAAAVTEGSSSNSSSVEEPPCILSLLDLVTVLLKASGCDDTDNSSEQQIQQ